MAKSKSGTKTRKRDAQGAQAFLEEFAERLAQTKTLQTGAIQFRLSGKGGGDYCLDCSKSKAQLSKGVTTQPSKIEVIGDIKRIRAILKGKKDGRLQFLAGGIRVRGDLRYLSDLAQELGIIKGPL